MTPSELRQKIRSGEFKSNTSGFCQGFVQCNLVILPKQWADDFMRFAHANPKPCPVVGINDEPGSPYFSALGTDIDIRSDIPTYRIFKDGKLAEEVNDIGEYWSDDLVAFALGCSFSFEEALIADGLEVRNITEGRNVPMYDTNIECTPAGPFKGNMVVSMRPMTPTDAIRAIQICTRFPSVHGAPVHFGDPSAIGIEDINQTNYGDAVSIKDGEVPVFWACGVTPQAVIEQAKPPFCITHAPGHMLVTDLPNSKLAVL